jgi:hypothetical protein
MFCDVKRLQEISTHKMFRFIDWRLFRRIKNECVSCHLFFENIIHLLSLSLNLLFVSYFGYAKKTQKREVENKYSNEKTILKTR